MFLLRKSRSLWKFAFFAFLIRVDVENNQSKTSENNYARSFLDHWLTSLEKTLKDIKNSAWLYRITVVNESSLTLNIHSWDRRRMYDRNRADAETVNEIDAETVDKIDAETVDEVDAETVNEIDVETINEIDAETVDEIESDLIAEIRSIILSIRTNACVLVKCKFHFHSSSEWECRWIECRWTSWMMRFLVHKTMFSAFEAQTDESRCLV